MSLLEPIRFAFYGTSLTTGRLSADWVPRIKNRLKQEPEALGKVKVYNLGKGSQTSDWGVLNAERVSRLRPTHILFEGFGINDCAIGPLSLPQSAANFDAMVAEWRTNVPDVNLTHQTMSPASASDANRTNLQTYYDQELARAVALGIPSLNHTPDWPPITAGNTYGTTAATLTPPTGFTAWDAAQTWNPSDKDAGVALTSGNLNMAVAGASFAAVRAGAGRSAGKLYFAVSIAGTGDISTGIAKATATLSGYVGSDANAYGYGKAGDLLNNSTALATYAAYASGDVAQFAVDFTALKLWIGKNGIWLNGNPATGDSGTTISAGTYYPAASAKDTGAVSLTVSGAGGDGLHPIWSGVFELYSYPSILAWAKARMGEFWA